MDEVAEKQEQTIGEFRVRTDFNANGSPEIDFIKNETAKLINFVAKYNGKDPRLVAMAQTAYEEAAMWAVKAATA